MSQENTQVAEATTALPQQNTPDQASSMALMLDAKSMESAMAIAEVMSKSKVTVPKHLQGQQGDCMAIVLQSMNWGMNPFAVAQKTHIVNGVLGYEAQLVNAVVSSQGFIKGTFKYEYKGEGNQLECRVGAIIKGDTKITWGEWLRITDVKIQNSPLWKTNPRQQMGYLQCKNWTRLYCPAAILGVYTPDELMDSPDLNTVDLNEKPQTQTGAQAAQAAQDQQAQSQESSLFQQLAKIANTEGMIGYGAAWKGLNNDQRNAIGIKNHRELQTLAKAYDEANPPIDQPPPAEGAPAEHTAETKAFVDAMEGKTNNAK